ncbi:carboxy terminal-processing peptidase [Permianibacter sp. IMCC34836]|uniref:carboxy terminal-processing peptidase n=1 Tax=Permianibacter fluminis TaxID=2738515 RepID=UPI0015582F0A|nr:carboxy terminal-processing peptidase [Permianibacter fluminis]NQD38917.1 carboxy terminal-processing peptidase [Permianibacter fluminis]
MKLKQSWFGAVRAGVSAFILAVVAISSGPLPAAPSAETLSPEPQHAQVAKYIRSILNDGHYSRPRINDDLSLKMFDQYLSMLDGNRSYFTQADIDQFSKYKTSLDDALARGDLSAPYEIFTAFQKRWEGRYDFAISLLQKPMKFDGKDSFVVDREKAPWPKNADELNELWRQRVKYDALNLKLAKKEWPEIKELLTKRYEAAKRRMSQTNSEDVFSYFMNAVTAAVDPHSNYFSPPQAENFDIEMKLSLEGIGAVLQTDDVYTKVARLVEMGPADKSKQIFAEDKIISVGQDNQPMVDVVGWRLDDVVDLIRGKAGSVVRLEVMPHSAGADGKTKIISLVREKVKLEEQAAKSEVIKIDRPGRQHSIGVITVPKFYVDFQARAMGDENYKSVARDVRDLLVKLKADKVDGVILDLRNNGGGGLDEAAQMSGLFIDQGPIVQERTQFGQISVLPDEDPGETWDGPLVVLINGQSASASEIVAAALQDYGRALIVGETSFGKGTVQTVVDLNRYRDGPGQNFGQIKLTVHKFYRVDGNSTQHRGVVPDIQLPPMFDSAEFGESSLPNAMPWDHIQAANYAIAGDVKKYVPQLKAMQDKRVAKDPEYQYLLQDIAEYNVRKNEKTVTLNEAERKAERDQFEKKQLARENARRKLKGLPPLKVLPEQPATDEPADSSDDVRLTEAANILSDLIWLQSGQRVVDASDSKRAARTN